MKIAIAGFAVEGRASYDYFKNQKNVEEIIIYDENKNTQLPKNAKAVLGPGAFKEIPEDFVVIRTSGLAKKHIPVANKVWSATNEFFAKCPAQIIGVTGTKGKGTTCTMIYDILMADNKKVHLIGNIGTPALAELPKITKDDIVVFELSSFQLWDLEYSPHIAVVLRIEADHLDVHDDFADYVKAKANIAKYQTKDDVVIYYENNEYSRYIASLSPGEKVPYPGGIEFDSSFLQVPGEHYIENAKAAIAATHSIINNESSIEKGLSGFRAMPHRLELIRELNGVKYYDDNYSASFPSLDVAIRAFPNNDIVLIAGGKDRGLDNCEDIADAINKSTIKKVFLIGETAPKLAKNLETENEICSSLPDAVSGAHQIAEPGDIVLMSPGAPSFDMFKSFNERAELFRQLVGDLK